MKILMVIFILMGRSSEGSCPGALATVDGLHTYINVIRQMVDRGSLSAQNVSDLLASNLRTNPVLLPNVKLAPVEKHVLQKLFVRLLPEILSIDKASLQRAKAKLREMASGKKEREKHRSRARESTESLFAAVPIRKFETLRDNNVQIIKDGKGYLFVENLAGEIKVTSDGGGVLLIPTGLQDPTEHLIRANNSPDLAVYKNDEKHEVVNLKTGKITEVDLAKIPALKDLSNRDDLFSEVYIDSAGRPELRIYVISRSESLCALYNLESKESRRLSLEIGSHNFFHTKDGRVIDYGWRYSDHLLLASDVTGIQRDLLKAEIPGHTSGQGLGVQLFEDADGQVFLAAATGGEIYIHNLKDRSVQTVRLDQTAKPEKIAYVPLSNGDVLIAYAYRDKPQTEVVVKSVRTGAEKKFSISSAGHPIRIEGFSLKGGKTVLVAGEHWLRDTHMINLLYWDTESKISITLPPEAQYFDDLQETPDGHLVALFQNDSSPLMIQLYGPVKNGKGTR